MYSRMAIKNATEQNFRIDLAMRDDQGDTH